jgi:hypothetical protein
MIMKKIVIIVCFILLITPHSTLKSWALDFEVRTIDGSNNNIRNPEYGAAGVRLIRNVGSDYADGVEEPAGQYRLSARIISNILAVQKETILNLRGASDFVWQWGQFIDHDIDLTTLALPLEPFFVAVPEGDLFFDPYFEGNKYIPLNRSIHDYGNKRSHPRQQLNMISAFIDASNVYGSDFIRAEALRTFEGGKLKTSSGGKFLPFNTEGLDNAGGPDLGLFLAGDIRANEQIALTVMHTLFVREHNRLCDEMAVEYQGMTDEEIYQWVRKIVGAQLQIITYNEFLPILLGEDALPPYRGYDDRVDSGISNEFSTAAFRFGHSMISPELIRINRPGQEAVSTSLKDAFFNPKLIYIGGGFPSMLRGLAAQRAQEVDIKIVDGIRNFLFGQPGEGGFDLASMNIQRGRDHGLSDYNAVRKAYGLKRVRSFQDVTDSLDIQQLLELCYGTIDNIDLWVAGLVEDHMPGAMVGETNHAILTDQFVRLRDGDRFWYQNDPFFISNQRLTEELEGTRLSDIIRRNSNIRNELQDNVFLIQ